MCIYLDNVWMYLHIDKKCLYVSRCILIFLNTVTMSRHNFVMLMVLSMTPLHSLGHNNHSEVKHHFFSHVMPLVPALLSCDDNCMAPFSSVGEDNWNRVSHDFFGHVMLLTPVQAWLDTDGTANGSILLGQDATMTIWSCDASGGITMTIMTSSIAPLH